MPDPKSRRPPPATPDPARLLALLADERARNATLRATVPGVIWEVWTRPDPASGRIDAVSEHITPLLGYGVDECLATPMFWLTLIHPDDRERVAADVRAIFEGADPPRASRFRWIARDGRAVWVESRVTVIHEPNGVAIGMRGVTWEVGGALAPPATRRASEEHRARLAREQVARAEAEASRRRFAFLARASAALASSLDSRVTIAKVVRLILESMADRCIVYLAQADGSLAPVEVGHSDPTRASAVRIMVERFPPDPGAPRGACAVFRTGTSELFQCGSDDTLVGGSHAPDHLELLGRAGMASGMIVPLVAHETPLGALTVISCDPNRVYGQEDVKLAEELGRHIALAVRNARLYADAQREIEDRTRAEARLDEQRARQEALAELGRLALSARGVDALLVGSVHVLARTLRLDLVAIAEILPCGEELELRAVHGWSDSCVGGRMRAPPESTVSGLTLAAGTTIVIEDLTTDPRVRAERLLAAGVVSVISVVVEAEGRRLGVVQGNSRKRRAFGADERQFVEAVARVVAEAWLWERAAATLGAEKELLAVTLRSIGDGVITTDTVGNVVLLNAVAERLTGWTRPLASGRPVTEVFDVRAARGGAEGLVAQALRSRSPASVNHATLRTRDGEVRAVAATASPIRDAEGGILGAVLAVRDVTEKDRIDAELQRVYTLESLGVLAGGIAHDFNNILTAILANLALAEEDVPSESPAVKRLQGAERAAMRARDLTQQLLTFSKGGSPIRRPASLAEIVRESAAFGLSGAAVQASFDLAPGLWLVDVDAGQISQVVQNLVINAKQAMPGGGRVGIALRNVVIEEGSPLSPGRYVRLDVADAGTGIAPADLPHIFDPFFTTKAHGSGLGLATAHAIVKKHDGHIGVESREGVGTSFAIFLPASTPGARAESDGAAPRRVRGTGRVLVMDDDAMVREGLGGLLETLGYRTTLVANGEDAIEAWRTALDGGERFSCVLLDLTVAGGMGGRDAIRAILALDPTARGIVSSGYSEDPVMSDCRAWGFVDVVAKPYTFTSLAAVLARVIAA